MEGVLHAVESIAFLLIIAITSAVFSNVEPDQGVCNFTSSGEHYSKHVHAPTTVRSLAVPATLVKRSFFCFYSFRAASNQRILINIVQLAVGAYNDQTQSCENGFIRIWDGIRQPGLYRYPPNTLCGIFTSRPRVQKISSDQAIEIELRHDDAHQRISLTFTYKYINLASVCHWDITWESCNNECTLTSPGYPGIYSPNLECVYHIRSLQNRHIAYQLSFTGYNNNGKEREFDIRDSKTDCLSEYVEVYDGDSTSAPKIGRYCGHKSVPDITSTGSSLLIVFITAHETPPYGYRGFHGSVQGITQEWSQVGERIDTAVCDWTYNTSQGSISSPDHWLPKKTLCTYTISVHNGHLLHLILTIYGLRPDCGDSIVIIENEITRARICQNTLMARKVLAATRAKSRINRLGDIEEDPNTFNYNLKGPQVIVRYLVSDGQTTSMPDTGFWLSFKQVPEPEPEEEEEGHDIQSDEASPIRGLNLRPPYSSLAPSQKIKKWTSHTSILILWCVMFNIFLYCE